MQVLTVSSFFRIQLPLGQPISLRLLCDARLLVAGTTTSLQPLSARLRHRILQNFIGEETTLRLLIDGRLYFIFPSADCFGTPAANLAALDSKAFGRASEAVAEMAQPSAEPGDDYE